MAQTAGIVLDGSDRIGSDRARLEAIASDRKMLEKLSGEVKQIHRLLYCNLLVEHFFAWTGEHMTRQGFTPKNPYIEALNYVCERRAGLELFLTDPDVPIDTNHIERALDVIPMARKSWLFCRTELGAKHVGMIQSLIVTCRLHGLDPFFELHRYCAQYRSFNLPCAEFP